MKNIDCLSEQDLTLHYYGELPAGGDQLRHLADCPHCTRRFAALSEDLEHFPKLTPDPDHTAGTRMAARVRERLTAPRRNWLPALAAATVATIALAVTMYNWEQQPEMQTVQLAPPALSSTTFSEDNPDIVFLDDLEVLKDLELLRQIEGV